LDRLVTPTLLLIGLKDTTAIGKDRAPPDVVKVLGNYSKLAGQAQKAIADATLVTFPELGHSPQAKIPSVQHTLLEQLNKLARRG
jgi:pimeloyl-ACP methyl ester carboxylesterase